MNQYEIRISFVEYVEGKPRSFVHSMKDSAFAVSEARRSALKEFYLLARESSVGWKREVRGVEAERLD